MEVDAVGWLKLGDVCLVYIFQRTLQQFGCGANIGAVGSHSILSDEHELPMANSQHFCALLDYHPGYRHSYYPDPTNYDLDEIEHPPIRIWMNVLPITSIFSPLRSRLWRQISRKGQAQSAQQLGRSQRLHLATGAGRWRLGWCSVNGARASFGRKDVEALRSMAEPKRWDWRGLDDPAREKI